MPAPRNALGSEAKILPRQWDPHPDRVVVAQVDKAEVCDRLDLSVASRVDLLFIDRKIADKTVAAITQNRLEEADLECFAR